MTGQTGTSGYRRGVRKAPLYRLSWLVLLCAGCLLVGGECPCGASTSDPIGEHDASFTGSHVVDGKCLCTCGEDFPDAFDKEDDCREHQVDCTDGAGKSHTYVCR